MSKSKTVNDCSCVRQFFRLWIEHAPLQHTNTADYWDHNTISQIIEIAKFPEAAVRMHCNAWTTSYKTLRCRMLRPSRIMFAHFSSSAIKHNKTMNPLKHGCTDQQKVVVLSSSYTQYLFEFYNWWGFWQNTPDGEQYDATGKRQTQNGLTISTLPLEFTCRRKKELLS